MSAAFSSPVRACTTFSTTPTEQCPTPAEMLQNLVLKLQIYAHYHPEKRGDTASRARLSDEKTAHIHSDRVAGQVTDEGLRLGSTPGLSITYMGP